MTTNTTPTDATASRQERYREVLATLESGIATLSQATASPATCAAWPAFTPTAPTTLR